MSKAFQVEPESLKQSRHLADAIAASLDGLDLVVQSFNESTGHSITEVVENGRPMIAQGVEKLVEAAYVTVNDFFDPGQEPAFGVLGRLRLIEESGELFSQGVSLMELG